MSDRSPLSAHERAALAELEDALRSEDPALDRTLRGDAAETSNTGRFAGWSTARLAAVVVSCLLLMPLGLALQFPALSLVAFAAAVPFALPLLVRLAPVAQDKLRGGRADGDGASTRAGER
ncbi:MAG: DUF3040 domain-containing protein [Nitriliruptoraceae bacterium]|nr:DUF3040 domain-containing protein [Nitriliruptoraceae bacterium]